MRTGRMFHRNAQTFLVHLFGRGLDDDRYVMARYRSLASGEIELVQAAQPKRRGRRKPRPTIASASAVKQLRPERDEIIVCTGVNLKNSGAQLWGISATGLQLLRNAR